MAYSFERHETVAVGVARIIGELTWTTTSELYPSHPQHQDWVHNTRTRYKRVRSLLRLIRKSLGREVYGDEMDRVREATGMLARMRDTEVLVQTADLLAERVNGHADVTELCEWSRERYRRIAHIEINMQQLLLATAHAMDGLTIRSANWNLPEGFEEPLKQFTRSYRRGRRQCAAAFDEPGDDSFHEWRKRVKDHLYHCRLFGMAWSPTMSLRVEEIKSLSDLLGEDHDLAVLRQVLTAESDAPALSVQLDSEIQGFQEYLRDRSREVADRIYEQEPESLGEELANSIKRWQ